MNHYGEIVKSIDNITNTSFPISQFCSSNKPQSLAIWTIHLRAVIEFHPLLEPESNSSLPRGRRLGEGSRSAKGTSSSTVADTNDADVFDTGDSGVAGHALGHADLEREFSVGGEGETLDTEAWDILGDLGGLEGVGVSAAGGAVDRGPERASTILVDLFDC